MGIFDAIGNMFGGGMPQGPAAPAAQQGGGMLDGLSSPLGQMGMQLIANHGTLKNQQGAFQGVPEALNRTVAQKKAEERQNKTLAYLEQHDPEVFGLVQAGLDPGEAFTLSLKRKQFAADEARASRGPGPTSEMRNFQFAQQNPEFAAMLGGSEQPTAIREINERARLAPTYNLDPNTPEGKAFVLTGKLPGSDRTVTAGDRQAIRDADDAAMSAENVSGLLDKAAALSDKAYEGMGASTRATLSASTIGDEGALATIEMDNIVKEQALGQLKQIFGAAPTEGERQILLQIQGGSEMPKSVRKAAFERAKALAARRLQFNRDRANELRGGTYYDPKPSTSTPGGPGASDPLGLR